MTISVRDEDDTGVAVPRFRSGEPTQRSFDQMMVDVADYIESGQDPQTGVARTLPG